ncbi:MAG: alkaline phosphatase [Clostridium sp.]
MLSKNTLNKVVALTGATLMFSMILSGTSSAVKANASTKEVKNVIYLIADGMSTSTQTSARYYKDYQDGVLGNDKLMMDKIQTGLVKTKWESGPITDSAPAGTALSSGFKTYNKHVGVKSDKTVVANVLEASEQSGKATGIIATSEIMHATPAAFSAHVGERSEYNAIMKQQIYQGMEVVLGGGNKFLTPEAGGVRADGKNLISEIENLGYDYVTDRDGLKNSTSDKLWGMFAESDLAYEVDREEFRSEEPSLSEMTTKAIEVLEKDEDGFFLMVEGSKVDWAAHANDPIGAITDTIAFDEAVKVAVDYANQKGDTIVVVTTDHANSGLSIGNSDTTGTYDNIGFEDTVANLQWGKMSLDQFNKVAVGKSDSEISALMSKYYGYKATQEEINLAKEGKVNQVVAKRSKLGYTTGGHTGGDVYLGVYAPAGVEKLTGTVDNTELAKYVERSLGINLSETTEKLYKDQKSNIESLGATYSINKDDNDNPYALINKDGLEVKIHANSNIVEVNNGDKVLNHQLPGVSVLSEDILYTSNDAVEVVKDAINNQENQDTNKPGDGGTNNNKPSGSQDNNKPGSSLGKLPQTGEASGIMVNILGMIVTTIGYIIYNKSKR